MPSATGRLHSGNSRGPVLPSEGARSDSFGIYVHWPYCEARCPYCDFNAYVESTIDHGRWRDALARQLDHYAREYEGQDCGSIFFGGGTPSLMEPETARAVVRRISSLWNLSSDAEVTLEANPSSIESGRFAAYREAGINRVSIGVQSVRDAGLKRLGRLHSARDARNAFETARTRFDRVSIDLIYGRQGQSMSDWLSELEEAMEWLPDHLSLYQLTIEPGTPFGRLQEAGRLPGLPDSELAADMYLATLEECSRRGYANYEVSNFAKPGHESRHNLVYWNCGDYIGIGPGAHGRVTTSIGRAATETFPSPVAWLRAVEETGTGESGRTWLSRKEQAQEYLMMSLRLASGMNIERYEELAGRSVATPVVADLERRGFLLRNGSSLRATVNGALVLNTIVSELLA